jgi:molybdopterin/thiamine biosynthesis adenylyltransferase/rhodanese-related sulfurtransferase
MSDRCTMNDTGEAIAIGFTSLEVEARVFADLIARGTTLVDVREPSEFEDGHLDGAILFPVSKLEALLREGGLETSGFPSRDSSIALYCASGRRSARAATALSERGYRVTSLKGGLDAWVGSGRTVSNQGVLMASERERYRRQTVLPNLGEAGQARLSEGRVLIIGAGGLGSPVALYLAAAGVGTIGLVDDDAVDLSNLQRQILYSETDLGRPKAETAASLLHRMNSGVRVVPHPVRIGAHNAEELISGYDVVCDCSDNFETRYAVNAAAIALGRALVHGAIHHFDGEVSVFGGDGPCYQCLHREAPRRDQAPSCAEAGVIGAICGVIGSLQAMEVVKLLTGIGVPLRGRLLSVDLRTTRFLTLKLGRDPACPCCSRVPLATKRMDDAREF